MRLIVATCLLCIAITPAIAQRSRAHHRMAKSVAGRPSTHDCGRQLTLRLSSAAALQGNLLLLELRDTAQPIREVKADWNSREIPFWQEPKSAEESTSVWRALLGVDLELKPEKYLLALTAKTESAEEIACAATIDVNEGKFATESLKVAPNFVQPDAEQLARAEAERQRLRAIFATITPERLWGGAFHYPLTGVTTGGNFGKRRILNGQPGSPHGGVDFPAAAGTPVLAPQRGQVVLAEPLYFSGNTVVLDHGLGLYTFYGHFESISVQAGEMVDTGAVLGKVGATGRVTGPHLHWGATVNRARTKPLQLIALTSTPSE